MSAAVPRTAQAAPPIEALARGAEFPTARLARVVGSVEAATAVRAADRLHPSGDSPVLRIESIEEVAVGNPVMGQVTSLVGVETPETPPRTK